MRTRDYIGLSHVACRNAPPPPIGVILHEEVGLWTFRPLDVSPLHRTFRPLDVSFRPRQWTVHVRPACDLPCAASLAGIQPVRPRAQRTSP